MTTFVLVHGAWHGPWAWDRLTPLLRHAGARSVTPALTSDGDAGLRSDVHQVVAALDSLAPGDRADGMVLVGHSYAGLVVRQAADQRPDLVDHVVLIDGWAGPDGASVFGLAPESFEAAMRASADGPHIPAPPPAAFGVTDPGDVDWLARRLGPQPLRTFVDATQLTGAVDRIPGTAICCHPATYPFDRFAAGFGYQVIPLDGPHNVMLSHPESLAELLLRAAAGRLQEPEAGS